MLKILTNGQEIRVETIDINVLGYTRKLDLLYYNNITSNGEVITTMVYNSGVRNANDTSEIIYNPNKLYQNNAFERNYTITGISKAWSNADTYFSDIDISKDGSIFNTTQNLVDTTTDTAVLYISGSRSYDGWYTLVSLGLKEDTVIGSVADGDIRYNTLSSTAEYADNGVWIALNNINSDVKIYNLIRDPDGNAFREESFFVSTMTKTLFNGLLSKKLDGQRFTQANSISAKLKTINIAVKNKAFDLAQFILRSLEVTLLKTLI